MNLARRPLARECSIPNVPSRGHQILTGMHRGKRKPLLAWPLARSEVTLPRQKLPFVHTFVFVCIRCTLILILLL